MTPEQAKLKQREDARRRSRQAPRRASSQAVSSDQSEVTEEAPAVYRVPQINVPEDLQGAAKLIQTELAKIEQSQSILLTLWEKLKAQSTATDSNGNPVLNVGAQVDIDCPSDQKIVQYREDTTHWNYNEFRTKSDGTRDAYIGVAPNDNALQFRAEKGNVEITSQSGAVAMSTSVGSWSLNPDGEIFAALSGRYFNTGEFNRSISATAMDSQWPVMSIPGWSIRTADAGGGEMWSDNADTAPLDATIFCYPCNNTPPNMPAGIMHTFSALNGGYMGQIHMDYSGNRFSFRTRNGDSATWNSWGLVQTVAEAEEMRKELKAEIYAELLELNPGIVIPKTD
ncbi:vWA domain-containing protein [Citrobacter freundii]|uniref:hypothetical protein n=1 Tax=Citrobacter freundii TaxID=546 RepID=UPI0018685479|nr:hypothetical protein [Citrobacter freundii]